MVALHLGVLAGAAGIIDHALHIGAHQVRGLLADDLPDLLGLVIADHIALGIGDRLDQVGLQQMAAVDHRGQGGNEMDGRGGKPLAKGRGGQLGDTGGADKELLVPERALLLTGQLNAGLAGKAKVLPVFIELLRPQLLSNIN